MAPQENLCEPLTDAELGGWKNGRADERRTTGRVFSLRSVGATRTRNESRNDFVLDVLSGT
jgi:hypothetical protein